MQQKLDINELKILYLQCIGGLVGHTSTLASKVGPLGLSAKKIGDDIAKATENWKGIKVTCKLVVQNRIAKIEVIPSANSLILQQLMLDDNNPLTFKKNKFAKGSGNLNFAQILFIARQMRHRSMAKKLEGTVKEILGTVQSFGCTVEGKHPHDFTNDIRNNVIVISDE